MKKIIKNYKSTLILLISIIIGGIMGIIFKEKINFLKPFGDLFLNLMYVVIVPLIFINISSAIIKMDNPKKIGKIIIRIIITFIFMSLISSLIGIFVTKNINLVDNKNIVDINNFEDKNIVNDKINILEKTVNLLTVDDFSKLLKKDNIIALIVFSLIFSFAVIKNKKIKDKFSNVLTDLNAVILNVVNIIMLYAPIGLGCYFAVLIGTYGNNIIYGFLKLFIVYLIVAVFIYVVVYSLYAYLSYGKKGLKNYWKNIFAPTITALATCSSAACIPINIKYTKMMGISDDIAQTTIPLGTSIHKDGSVLGSCFKIMFLVYMFNLDLSIVTILGISILATLLITAVPIGGGTISEVFIISMLGIPLEFLPILTIIATVIDAPATVLNVVGDSSASMIVSKLVNKKELII